MLAIACGSDDKTPTGTTTTPTAQYQLTVDSAIIADSTGRPVAEPFTLLVHLTKDSVAAADVPVTWTITAGNGDVSTDTSRTDAAGVASVVWTLGDTAGTNSIFIKGGDASLTYNVNGIGAVPDTLVAVSADSSIVVATASLALTVRVLDRFGNAVPGATVHWNTTGGDLTVSEGVTGASGNSMTVFSTPATPGDYTITASMAGLPAVTFNVKGL